VLTENDNDCKAVNIAAIIKISGINMIYRSNSWIEPLKNARQPAPMQTHAAVFFPLEDFLFAERKSIIPTTRTTTPADVFNTGPVPLKRFSR
jgi:hypothetical protein